ncbi:MAG: DNA polymerase III subunit beta [Rikenellaceae bacterium]
MMKFTISSSLLSQNLQAVARVISNKNTLPILDYFLFEINDNSLRVTASDLETTLQCTLSIDNQGENGSIAVPAKRLSDSIKEFSEQPLVFEVDTQSWDITIVWQSGRLVVPGSSAMGYPEIGAFKSDEVTRLTLAASVLNEGVGNTIFATTDDPLRPVMAGINVAFSSENVTFVATDGHRLVRLQNNSVTVGDPASFILPHKPAQLLRSVLPKDGSVAVELAFDAKNIEFVLPNHRLICRRIEGVYPNYNAVIPTSNDKRITVDRLLLLGAIKRVSVCSNQASELIQFTITMSNIKLLAQDVDFATSAVDNIACQYMGEELNIGFKSSFLQDLLSIMTTQEVVIELADPTRPGLFMPFVEEQGDQSLLMLLMPMTINM